MSKRSDPAAFARATGAPDPVTLAEPAPTPDLAPLPESAGALAIGDAAPEVHDCNEVYSPAEYRWVPVRRKPRHDGWTEEKQRRFIETLADTGLVNVAARAVGMTRASAYQLRRAEHGAAFARAWDKAREHASGLVEDILFERAIEGTEEEVLDSSGEVMATKLVHDNGLLKWLLGHLKPERYGSDRARAAALAAAAPEAAPALGESLRAMEPVLPAPPEQLLGPEVFADELEIADLADGKLPHFLNEQPRPKTDDELRAEEAAAREARGEAAMKKSQAGGKLTADEFADECYYLDPVSNKRPRPRRRKGVSVSS